MVKSTATTVEDYLAELPAERREVVASMIVLLLILACYLYFRG